MLSVKPRVRVSARYSITDGDLASDFSSGYGLIPDDWQDDALDDWLGRRANGRYANTTCGLCVGRQNGKNGVIEVRELYGMVSLGEKFLHSAHEVKTARKAFKRLKYFFGDKANDPNAKFPELNALVLEVRSTNGQEAIILKNGGSVEFVARSKGSGRGFTVDVLVLDEAQDLTNDELEAMLSTISAAPLGNPQVIFTGTPPNPDKGQTAEVFTRVRAGVGTVTRGVAGKNKRLAFIDFGVEDGPMPDIEDPTVVKATNPALGTRLQQDVLDMELELLSAEGYARERLGWWGDPKVESKTAIFGPGGWTGIKKIRKPVPAPEAIAIAVSYDRAYTSIGACSADDTPHLGAVDRRRGTGWVVAEAKRLQDEHGVIVALDGKSASETLIEPLEEAGVRVLIASTDDYLGACGTLFDEVTEHQVEQGDYDDLNDAVAGATTRKVGQRWAWARGSGDVDMLEAVTLARWAAGQATEVEAWGFWE